MRGLSYFTQQQQGEALRGGRTSGEDGGVVGRKQYSQRERGTGSRRGVDQMFTSAKHTPSSFALGSEAFDGFLGDSSRSLKSPKSHMKLRIGMW